MIPPKQILDHVIVPTLLWLDRGDRGIDSENARYLLLGTGAHESRLFSTLVQDRGPARSFWQIEKATFYYLHGQWLPKRKALYDKVNDLAASLDSQWDQISGNLYLACAYARCVYRSRPGTIPSPDDIEGMAAFWGKYYQTESDPDKMGQFAVTYMRHVLPLVESWTLRVEK